VGTMDNTNALDDSVKIVDINDQKFLIKKLPARQALLLKARLLKVAAPILGELPGIVGTPEEAVGRMMGMLPQVDEEKVVDIIVSMCETAFHQSGPQKGMQVTFDAAFNDDLTPAYRLAFEIGKLNFMKYYQQMGNAQALIDSAQNNKQPSTSTETS